MKSFCHALLVTFGLTITAGCGLVGKDNVSTKDKRTGYDADAQVENGNFSLSLPDIPVPKPAAYKAHLRIYQGSLPMPEVRCHPDGKPMPVMELNAIYEDSLPYVSGTSIGPVKLNSGKFTALLDIYDGSANPGYSGVAFFAVNENEITEAPLKLQKTDRCEGGSGGVVINPVLPGNETQTVSACDFVANHPLLCENSFASCHYEKFSHKSQCGLADAKAGLISQLCAEKVLVEKESFLKQIECSVESTPQPEEEIRLHAVGIYEARSDHSFNYHPTGKHVVRLGGGGRVILALTSYEPTEWQIDAGETVVERVIVYGYHKQSVIGAEKAKIDIHCYEGCSNKDYYNFYKHPSAESKKFLSVIKDATGLEASSVQGAYTSKETKILNK